MNDKIFAERLKEARQKADFSQAELSRRTGIASATLSSYEKGKMPPIDKAFQIAEALNVSLDWLCGKPAVSERNAIKYSAQDYFESLAITLSEANTSLEYNQDEKKAIITINEPKQAFYCKRVDELLKVYESGLLSDEMYIACIDKLYSDFSGYHVYLGNILTSQECGEAASFIWSVMNERDFKGVIKTAINGVTRSLLLSYDAAKIEQEDYDDLISLLETEDETPDKK